MGRRFPFRWIVWKLLPNVCFLCFLSLILELAPWVCRTTLENRKPGHIWEESGWCQGWGFMQLPGLCYCSRAYLHVQTVMHRQAVRHTCMHTYFYNTHGILQIRKPLEGHVCMWGKAPMHCCAANLHRSLWPKPGRSSWRYCQHVSY